MKPEWSPPVLSKEWRNGRGEFFLFFTTTSSSSKSSHTCSRDIGGFYLLSFVSRRWLDALWKCAITDVSGTSALPIHPSFLCLWDGAPPPPVVPAHWFQGLQKGAPQALIFYMGAEKHFYSALPSKPRCLPTACANRSKLVILSNYKLCGPCPKSNCTACILGAYRAFRYLNEQRCLLCLHAAALLILQSCFLVGLI